jgi:hypothetical protein
MAKRLTTKAIENAKPRADRYEISDGGGPLRFVGRQHLSDRMS